MAAITAILRLGWVLFKARRPGSDLRRGKGRPGRCALSKDGRWLLILWINGPFGAGKTTVVEHLAARLPDAMVFDPEEIGCLLRRLVPPPATGDFQDLPIWRSLTVRAIVEVRHHYRRRLLVPMTLVRPDYVEEIFGGLRDHGQQLMHFFLDPDEATLRSRIEAQVLYESDPAQDAKTRAWRLAQVERCLAARPLMPASTVFLDSGTCSPSALAEAVLALTPASPTEWPSAAGPDDPPIPARFDGQ